MGNLLCVPKSKKRQAARDSNKEKIWISKSKKGRNRISDQTPAPVVTSLPVIHEQEVSKQSSANLVTSTPPEANFHIDPVVSSSILLKNFDEEIGDDKEVEEAPEKSDDPVDMGKNSLSVSQEPQTAEDSEPFKDHADIPTTEVDKPVTQLECSSKESNMKEAATDIELADMENLSKSDNVSSEISEKDNIPSVDRVNGSFEPVEINADAVRVDVEADVEKNSSTKDVSPHVIQVKPCCEYQFETHDLKKDFNDKEEPSKPSLQKKSDKPVFAQSSDKEALARADSKDIASVIDVKVATPKLTNDNYGPRSGENPIADDQSLVKTDVRETPNTKHYNLNDFKTGKVPEYDQKFRCTNLSPSASRTKKTQKEEVNLKGAYSCPVLPKASKATAHMRELAKVLEALSAIKIPPRSDAEQSVNSQSFSRNVLSPQPTTSDLANRPGYYKSEEGIQKWLKNSASDTADHVKIDKPKQNDLPKRKVSDFEVPKKAARKPQAPLVLKKPMPHLFSLPSIAKTDLEEDKNVQWTQKDIKGPQTDVLWANKPTSYDVKFPPLPKRLLEREGSIEKMRDDLVLPQTKQIETLKREYGRFPGLKIPQTLKDKYSFEIQIQNSSNNVNGGENNFVPKSDRDDHVDKETNDTCTRNGGNM